jgi:hypothetical protein
LAADGELADELKLADQQRWHGVLEELPTSPRWERRASSRRASR